MEQYATPIWIKSTDAKEDDGDQDFILQEKFNLVHPRGVVRLRRGSNNSGEAIYHKYNTSDDSIIKWLNRGNNDPLTREPFTYTEKDRITLYNKCYKDYPDRKLEDISEWLPELYNAWIDTYVNPNEYNEDEKKKLEDEANCFLQFEDIADAFLESDPGSYENRRNAQEKLENKPVGAWLIRKSSIKDNDKLNLYAYVITTKYSDGRYTHVPLIHSYGKGIYNVKSPVEGPGRGYSSEKGRVKGYIYPTALSFFKGINASMDKSMLVLDKIREREEKDDESGGRSSFYPQERGGRPERARARARDRESERSVVPVHVQLAALGKALEEAQARFNELLESYG